MVASSSEGGDGSGAPAATTAAPQPTFTADGLSYPYPTAAPESDEPLGAPVELRRAGTFAYLRTQPDDDRRPVAWDPCRTIHVVISDEAAPAGSGGIVEDALTEVSMITGLRIEVEGPTDEVPAAVRAPVQPDRYGDRWAPLLVAWTDPTAVDGLDADTGGLGGATAVAPPGGGPQVYVTGQLLLDAPQLAASLRVAGGRDQVRSVVLHEMGHVLGLAHVDDAGQLMYPEGRVGEQGYGPGDLAGLVELGQGPCAPGL